MAIVGVDDHIADPGEGGLIGHDPSEAYLPSMPEKAKA